MRGIKNREKLTTEYLLLSLSKSESSASENNFNNNNTDDDDDDDDDDRIRGKIRYIKIIFNRLGNIVTK